MTKSTVEVLVCGVGGITGDAVLAALADRGVHCRALVHREERRDAAIRLGAAEVVVADYGDPVALSIAMTQVTSVFFVAPVYQEAEPDWVRAAVKAAEAAGVDRFVYQSVLHAYTPSMPHHVRKAESEVIVRSSTLRWTVIQPAMYAQTVLRVRARSVPGALQIPYDPDAKFTVIDLGDIAECVAEILSDPLHAYAGYELAGGELLSVREMGQMMDHATGESRQVEKVDPDSLDLPASWSAQQRSEYALMCAEYDRHGLQGAATTATVLLRRPPTLFAEVASRELTTQGATS